MPRRAILKFRNPDSTQDLNDRYSDLFNKGYFWGGALKAVNGALKVDLEPFATAGSDGMFVREDSETTRLDVLAGFKNYIVIRQEYISNSDPVLSLESLTEEQFDLDGPTGAKGANNPTLIVFGVVNVPALTDSLPTVSVLQGYIETYESDIIDDLGRSPFRGLLSAEINLPVGLNANRAGDYYIISDGTGDDPFIFAWNGVSWVNITNAEAVANDLSLHSQNLVANQKHLTDDQLDAAAGSVEGPTGAPNDDNRYVVEQDSRLLTQAQADANLGNGLPLEDADPGNSNRWISSLKVFAVPTEEAVVPSSDTNEIELTASLGGFYVGFYESPGATDAVAGTVQQWFNIYTEDYSGDEEYTNDDFNEVQILQVRSGTPGLGAFGSGSVEVDPSVTGTTDALGFYVNPLKSLYLVLSNEITGPVRVAYGKRGYLGELLPQQLMNRGPKGGQIDTRIARLLFGTPNAQFEDANLWDSSSSAGDVVAWNEGTAKFVLADPDNDLDPVGVRGNFNNLIMEGLYTATINTYTVGKLYADKANPGSLTNAENEWFIGRAISATQLLVNALGFAGFSTEPTTPVQFPANLFENSLQAGNTCYWNSLNSKFEAADSVTNLPLGIRGNDNNVIQSGKYSALSGNPFVSGTRYYAGASPGFLITEENDWFMGIGIDSTTLLVNANAVPIPSKWTEEHYSGSGYHKFKIGDSTDRDTGIPSPGTGMLFIRDDTPNPSIEYWTGLAWASATTTISSIPSGSKMLFVQDTVPTGWTLDTTVTDKVIRVVDSAASGGVTGGNWTISGISGAAHQLIISEIPSHTHNALNSTITPGVGNFQFSHLRNNAGYPGSSQESTSANIPTGGDGSHSHGVTSDGTWRPSYINAIICIKD